MREKTGIVFDIKEFAIHDGPGMRVTVFMKGCPLRCIWCHNPEGLLAAPQLVKNSDKCMECGLCEKAFPCKHPECQEHGVCIHICPRNLMKISGKEYSVAALVERLARYKVFFERGGGVTFSGGEPTMQAEFLLECLVSLRNKGIRTGIETSAYCSTDKFLEICDMVDDIYIDLKETDDEKHKLLTGVSNGVIIKNILALAEKGRTFTVRMPLIPSVNDSDEELSSAAKLLLPYKDRIKIELLPYNTLTGAKYRLIGMDYNPSFDEKLVPNTNTEIFTREGFDCVTFKH